MKVLVILEDPTHDQYVVKPIVQKLFDDLGLRARVEVLLDPHLRGIDQALDGDTLQDIVDDHPMMDRFILVVDRDCDRMGNTERVLARQRDLGDRFLGCLAVEEVEVWMLALYPANELPSPWREIRAHCDPKEHYADPFLAAKGWTTEVGRGRKHAMDALRGGLRRLLSRCPELADLRGRIEAATS